LSQAHENITYFEQEINTLKESQQRLEVSNHELILSNQEKEASIALLQQ
jgi:hypothetical protein